MRGFVKNLIGTGLKGGKACFCTGIGGDDDDGQPSPCRIGAQAAQHVEAPHIRQFEVKQDEIGAIKAQAMQGLGPGGGEDGLVEDRGKACLQNDAIRGHIVDDQNPASHSLSCGSFSGV
jgi:hypothetical protein